jgi:hypothetical protein
LADFIRVLSPAARTTAKTFPDMPNLPLLFSP